MCALVVGAYERAYLSSAAESAALYASSQAWNARPGADGGIAGVGSSRWHAVVPAIRTHAPEINNRLRADAPTERMGEAYRQNVTTG